MTTLETLRKMAELSQTMASLAAQGKWDELCAAESQQRKLLESLASQSLSRLAADPSYSKEIAAILAGHETVAEYVTPWMQQVAPLLKVFSQTKA